MKTVLALLATLACGLALPKTPGDEHHYDTKQQHVYDLLKYINNPLYNKEFLEIAEKFDVKSFSKHYKNEAYESFMDLYGREGFLKRGEIFSILNHEHMVQARALFKLFFYSDTYETFHHTAIWARHHLNEGVFLYSYSVAIVHRPDTRNLVLPPVYELFPHHFFNSEVLQRAYRLKMSHDVHENQHELYTIHANYSGYYLNLYPEQSLSYYLEDVGLNALHFYYHIHYPYWMNSEEFHLNNNRGELFYFVHKQLYARYHLERFSHGLGDVEDFNWDLPFKTGYYPSLTYANGLPFPERPVFANLREYVHYYGQRLCDRNQNAFDYTNVQTYEQRIREAIDSGFVLDHDGNKHQLYSEEGINILGNIIEGNADSPNNQYYGSFIRTARHLLGYSKHPLNHHKLAPSALEHYSTSLRDPAFYQILKKTFTLIDQYKQNLPHYRHKHLHQEGLKIENVEFDKLVTYYDHFFSDITNGLFVSPEEFEQDSFRVKVHQYRLNHKNFNYKVHVKADKATKAAVRVFIGPKYDEHGRPLRLSEIHDKIYQIDYFAQDLKAGDNIITRNSADCYWFIKDFPSFFENYHQAVTVKKSEIQHGMPLRFKLPRGREEGLTFQIYVIVYPYVHNKNADQHQEIDGLHVTNYIPEDSFPWGYPFDRPAEHEGVYNVQNAFVVDAKIYHEVNKEIWNEDYHFDSFQSVHDDDVELYQRGDHNNYKKYHYQASHDDQVDDGHVKNYVNNYKPFGGRGLLYDLLKSYPGIQKHVITPQQGKYQARKFHDDEKEKFDEDHGDTQLQYKKKNIYDDVQVNGDHQKYVDYGNENYHGQQYVEYPVSNTENYYSKYQKQSDKQGFKHPIFYPFGDGKKEDYWFDQEYTKHPLHYTAKNGEYQKKSGYGKYIDTMYNHY